MKLKNLDLTVEEKKLSSLNKFLFQEDFQKRLDEIRKIKITITDLPKIAEIDIVNNENRNGILKKLEQKEKFTLNPKRGNEFAKSVVMSGYDESKLEFVTLEGLASFISHSLVTYAGENLLPVTYLSFYFYSRSENLLSNSEFFKPTSEPDVEEKRDYAKDRNNLITQYAVPESLICIDGPLIGGNLSSSTIELVKKLESKNVVPIFIVKNSDSNLVTDNIPGLKHNFNSDLHWAYNLLKPGERTNMYLYEDAYNPLNSKAFFYLKPFSGLSPQRIEFHKNTFDLHSDILLDIFDTIYYLFLAHGDPHNPQVRPIAVAEKYAREVLRLINPYSFMKSSGIIPTVNQTRFGA